MKRKHIAISLLLALAANLSAAAKPNSEPATHPYNHYNLPTFTDPDSERASHYIPYNLRTLSSAALEPDTMSAPPTLLPQPASTYDAATAAKTDITYTPYSSAKDTRANNDHSYRKILGETADGRLVIQDYYQNSGRPLTAPYILNRYGDPQTTIVTNADSKLVWYRQDGSVYAIQHYHDGQPAGHLSYYRNGRLVAQTPRPDNTNDFYAIGGNAPAGTRYYYDDGHILALEYQQGRIGSCYTTFYCEAGESLYAPDGTPLLAWRSEQSGDIISSQSWNTLNTTPADQQAARLQSINAALTRWDDIKQRLSDNDLNQPYHHDETANQLPPPVGEGRGGVSPHIAESNREPATAANKEPAPDNLSAPADLPAPAHLHTP